MRRVVSLLASFTIAAVAVAAAPRDFASDRAAVDETLIGCLESLADWCGDSKLYLEKDKIFEQILEVDPDNKRARRALNHSQLRDGSWRPPEKRKMARNYDPKLLEKLPTKRIELLKPYRDEMFGLIQEHGEAIPPVELGRLYDAILAVDPEDEEVRLLRGDVKHDGKWVLPESVHGRQRRLLFKSTVAKAKDGAPEPEGSEADEMESQFGMAWAEVVETPLVRVLSTQRNGEATDIARAVHTAAEFVKATFAVDLEYPENYRIYLLAPEGEHEAFLYNHPAIPEDQVGSYALLTGAGFPNSSDAAWWDEDPARRLDGLTRHTVSQFLSRTFGLTPAQGWAWEGLGLYMTRELVGTRLTWYVQPAAFTGEEDESLRAELLIANANWINEGYKMLKRDGHESLREVVSQDLSAMSLDGMLCSYVLAAYLLEARFEEAPQLLELLGTGATAEEAFQKALGLDLDQLEDRLRRWLSERR